MQDKTKVPGHYSIMGMRQLAASNSLRKTRRESFFYLLLHYLNFVEIIYIVL